MRSSRRTGASPAFKRLSTAVLLLFIATQNALLFAEEPLVKDSKLTTLRDAAQQRSEKRAQAEAEGEDPDVPPFAKDVIEKGDFLRARGAQVMQMRGLPYESDGENPRVRAIMQMDAQEDTLQRAARAKNGIAPNFVPSTWVALGPAPIPNGQVTRPVGDATVVPVSGRTIAIAVHPTNPDLVYAGTAQGGLYRSADGGTTWTPLMDGAASMVIGAIAIAPSDPTTIFVGTGEPGFSSDSFFGVGLYRITSADTTPVIEGPFGATEFSGRSISRILVDPADANKILVSSSNGVGGIGAQSAATLPSRGVYRSFDALAVTPTFTKLTTGQDPNRAVTDMIMDPNDKNVVLINVYDTATGTGVTQNGGVYRSTNVWDATASNVSFTRTLPLNVYRAEFGINHVGGTTTAYVASGEPASGAPCTHNPATTLVEGTLRKSTDGGQTWTAPIGGANGFCNGQCFYDIALAVHPTDANNVLLGGAANSTSSNPCRASVYIRSTNGSTFTRSDNYLHADSHAVVFAPSNPSIVYMGNDGGIYRSADGGATWTSKNTAGFSATQFMSVATHPADVNFSIGGTQDNGTQWLKPDDTWTRADFGDGGHAAIDPYPTSTTAVTMYHTYFNQQNSIIGFGRVTSTTSAADNGWAFLGQGGNYNGIGNDSVLFYAPIVLGPGNPAPVYFGTTRLYRSARRGLTMTLASQNMTARIATIAIAASNDNIRLVGLTNGKIWGTVNGSTTLIDMTTAGMPAQYVGRLMINPSNPDVAYAAFGGFGTGASPIQHVWKTTNLTSGSPTWTASSTGLPDVPVNALEIDPTNTSTIYAGTDIGVYSSTDGGMNWAPFGSGMPRVAVFGLSLNSANRVLRAATHGKGMFEIALTGASHSVLSIGTVATALTGDDGDAVLEPGEGVSFDIPLSNVGPSSATSPSLTITTSTPGVTINGATSGYGDIASAGSGTNTTPFSFTLNSNFVCGSSVNLLATVTTTDAPGTRVFPLVFSTGVAGATAVATQYLGSPVAIPDDTAQSTTQATTRAGVSIPLVVSGYPGSISDIDVKFGGSACTSAAGATTVGLSHTFVGDLEIRLISPSGREAIIWGGNGSSGNNLCNTILDDAAGTSVVSLTAANAPYTGTFRPTDSLSLFNGDNPNGTWTLKVLDPWAGDTGSVRDFSLLIKTATCTLASNTAPSITGGPTVTRTQGESAISQVATVSDNETNAGYLQVTVASAPAGITVSNFSNNAGTVSAKVLVACNVAPGNYNVDLQVSDGQATNTASFTVTVNPVVPPAMTVSQSVNAGRDGHTASIPAQAGSTYVWSITGGSISSGQGTNAISFRAGYGPTLTVSLSFTNPNGCNMVINTPANVLGVVAMSDDLNFDHSGDLVWRNAATGENAAWLMDGDATVNGAYLPTVAALTMRVQGLADFDGDSRADILWRNSATGENAIWTMNGGTLIGGTYLPTVADANMKIAGVGDFDADGNPDILWRNDVSGATAVWLMNRTSLRLGVFLPTVTGISVKAVADINGDHMADVIWRDDATGTNAVWIMNGSSIGTGAYLPSATSDWRLVQVGDFNADTRGDILWRNINDGSNAVWLLDGASIVTGSIIHPQPDLQMQPVALADVNNDGLSDIVWRNGSTGANELWMMGPSLAIGPIRTLPTVGDVNMEIVGR